MESKSYVSYNGGVHWILPNGSWHREDGPAIIWEDGTKQWFINDRRHRLDGPAVIRKDGTTEWWVNDYSVTVKIKKWAEEMNIDLDNLTDEDKFMIRLYWENYSE